MWTCASVLFLILCSRIHATTSTGRTTSFRPVGRCGLKYFLCDSGQCINEDNLCDGKADCRDASDETIEACWDIRCPKFIYRCNYGACVSARAKCNGITECLDGSDEAYCAPYAPRPPTTEGPSWTTTHTRPTPQPINCLIPNHPENGIYAIGDNPSDSFLPGDVVAPFSVLVTKCNADYIISPANNQYSVCANGIWTPIPSTCSRFSQTSNEATPAQCHCYC